MKHPLLYSFRRCPYAMRARIAIYQSAQIFELREVVLKNKPAEMLQLSPKGTVPVAVIESFVIDESLELMLWVLATNDPDSWLRHLDSSLELVFANDFEFKHWLDRYKYHVGYPEYSQLYYRNRASEFLQQLEACLSSRSFLIDDQPRLADAAIFPFVRQFAFVDKPWFDESEFDRTKIWLDNWLSGEGFQMCMQKVDAWKSGDNGIVFPPT